MSIGGHQSPKAKSVDWITPPEIINALGKFDLDPCAARRMSWATATTMWTEHGLEKPWTGRVWLNPPYGRQTEKWMEKLVDHGDGIALIFARTETGIFWPWVWSHASALFFFRGRLHFYRPNGKRAVANAGAPSVLVAYGSHNAEALKNSGLDGAFVLFTEDATLD